MAKTLIGVFDDKTSAQNATRELEAAGVKPDHLRLMDSSEVTTEASREGGRDLAWTERIARWFGSLVEDEGDREQAAHYAEAWRRGHYVVTADVDDDLVDRAAAIMNRHGTVDLSKRIEHWKSTGYTGTLDRAAEPYTAEQRSRELAAYEQAIPVVQEELAVGKRIVQRGGVRIHSYVTETPVEEVVRLREERIQVLRRPVDRPIADRDEAFKERTIEVNAMGEEPVVGKRARVVEEVVVDREVEQRDETIKETVRREDVQVQTLPDTAPSSAPSRTTTPKATPAGKQQPDSRR